MGVVIRQSFYSSIISYTGIVLGYINLLYLYPKFLDLEQIGLLRTILDFAILLAFFAQAGLSQSIIRFHPHFVKEGKQQQHFINYVLLLGIVSYIIFLIVFFSFKEQIINFFGSEAEIITQYIHLVLWLTFIVAVNSLMESFARTQMKLAFPRFLNEVLVRLLQGIFVTLYFTNIVTFPQLLVLSVVIHLINLIGLLIYLIIIGQFKAQFVILKPSNEKQKQFITYTIISLVSSGAFVMVGKLDSLMVTALINFEANAIYTTAFYMAAVIEIPRRILSQANSTLMARAFEQNSMNEISILYSKTSINQLIIGGLLLIGIWANLHNVYQIMPNGQAYQAGFMVVVIVGASKLLDMTFGPNTELLAMSDYYWFNTVALLFMAAVGVTLNYILIPIYGVDGAAYGTGLAFIFYNLIKFGFIYIKFKLQPFSTQTIIVLVIIGLTVLLNLALPHIENPFVDIIYRSAIITIAFSSLVLFTNSSEDISMLFRKGLRLLGILK